MKTLLFSVLSVSLLIAATPSEREAKLQNVVDMKITHTERIEKRISKIEHELERKSKERAKKTRLLEEKIKKRDEELEEKAVARAKQAAKY